jgi:hypothetical protein
VHLLEHRDQLVASLVADAGGREDAAPVGEDQVDAAEDGTGAVFEVRLPGVEVG